MANCNRLQSARMYPAQMRDLMLGYMVWGGYMVLDPFAGSGTTLEQAYLNQCSTTRCAAGESTRPSRK
jgi:hypothetical protein